MKKLFYICSLALVLAACGSEDATKEAKEASETPKQENTQNTDTTDTQTDSTNETQENEVETDDMEVKDGPLLKAGQWTMNGESKVTLIKIKEDNQPYTVGPMILTVKSVKLLQLTNVPVDIAESIKTLHGQEVIDGVLNTIQIDYSVENTTDKNIMFKAVDAITTDTKAQILASYNMAQSNDPGNYKGQVIVDGVTTLPYFNGKLEEINAIKVVTGDVWDDDERKKLSPSQKIEIAF